MAGNANSGRGTDTQNIARFKKIAWQKICDRCTDKNPKVADEYLDKYITLFASKMMPTTVEGTGKNGEIRIKIESELLNKYVNRNSSDSSKGQSPV